VIPSISVGKRLKNELKYFSQLIQKSIKSFAALFITAQEMIPHRQTLIYMGWPQPKTPIQTDKSTAAGVTNNTIVPRRSKMMDMRFWWLRCRESQYPRPVSVLLGCRIKKL
jgi:hypothetical protein